MMKQALCALALAAATLSAQAGSLTTYNFQAPAGSFQAYLTTNGFVTSNESNPVGTALPYFQGAAPGFSDQGGDGGFASANYLASQDGGFISDYLITPLFSTTTGGYISLFLRGLDPAYADSVQFGFSTGGKTAGDFTFMNAVVAPTDKWTQFSFNFDATNKVGTNGRFAIRYFGFADNSSAIGIDTLAISVPEPTTTMMLGLGFAGLIAARRRKAK